MAATLNLEYAAIAIVSVLYRMLTQGTPGQLLYHCIKNKSVVTAGHHRFVYRSTPVWAGSPPMQVFLFFINY